MLNDRNPTQASEKRPGWNLPHLIKWIILILLVFLLLLQLATGEYGRLMEGLWTAWLILVLKLVLIGILIWLMRVQLSLKCEILEPKGCATLEYDATTDSSVVVVRGTAGGGIFASYTLSLELSGTPQTITIDYPGGGSSGVLAVTNGELGRLHTETLEPTTGYQVILTVQGTTGATKICMSSFDLKEQIVYIDAVGKVPAQTVGVHPSDPTEPLKLIKETPGAPTLPGDPVASVGGSVSIEGGADVFGCNRQMSEWALQHRVIPAAANPWEADAAGVWHDIRVLPIWNTDPDHPRRYLFLGTQLLPNFVVNGDLTRQWFTRSILQSLSPIIYANRRVTQPVDWNTKEGATPLNGHYTVRLRVRHDQLAGGGPIEELFDAVNVWIDNRQIHCLITALAVSGGTPLAGCDELLLSQFVVGGSKVNMEIIGRAWDPTILDPPYSTDPPNDNFGHYSLNVKKDGATAWEPIVTGVSNPVPSARQVSLPAAPGDVGTLHSWDIVGALDAGPKQPGSPPYPKLYRGERCAYLIQLYVTDTTWINDKGDHNDLDFYWPFCIENDIPEDAAFPLT
jgi:hypothetical protein